MQNKTRYARRAVLNHFLGRSPYAFPAGVWLGLFTADPTDLGLLTNEVSSLGYARVEISDLLGDADLVSGIISNAANIDFAPAGEDWPEVTHLGILDVVTLGAGNMVYFGPAVTSRIVEKDDTFKLKIGQLTIREK
jgi:hypothetical protein